MWNNFGNLDNLDHLGHLAPLARRLVCLLDQIARLLAFLLPPYSLGLNGKLVSDQVGQDCKIILLK